jgi:hypothetical protein
MLDCDLWRKRVDHRRRDSSRVPAHHPADMIIQYGGVRGIFCSDSLDPPMAHTASGSRGEHDAE